ncbi:NAD(P)/FAD-dependent oxidoreductase [Sphingobacterium endophyticum]|uniref:NAD(P)/FAD-dependent oxidoreductase n=1 Tax=Sphingobacterium endophyticum TaxID=2546448 RepID=UPI0012E298BE|nr:FAD-binding oxidoreductase [Sphingobacterium endophyticum]
MDLKSNEPFWLVKNGILNSYPSLRENKSCDVLIVGGGITGSLIAHQCIEDGYKTILIDKREIVNGSSSATTSMLQYEIDTPLYKLEDMIGKDGAIMSYKACSDAIDKLGEISKRIKSKAGFKKKKSLYYACRKKDLSWLKKEFLARVEAGFTVKWMEEDEIVKTFKIQDSYGGILSEQGGSVDAFKLAHELIQYNYEKGLEVYDKTELINVEEKKGFNKVYLDTEVEIRAKQIIYCVGYESANMIKEKFVDLLSTYAIVSEINQKLYEHYNDYLIWNTAEPYLYMRTTDDCRFLIGGEDEEFRDPQKRDELLFNKSKKLTKDYYKVFNNEEFIADFSWAGTFGETKDGLPYIGTHQDFKRSYFVLGFGGNGITFSVTGMEMVSDWLKGIHNPLSPYFAFGR